MDPTLIAGLAGVAGKALQPPSAGPSSAGGSSGASTQAGSHYDGSGWTVSTGSSKATGATMGMNWTTILMVGGVGLVALFILKKHKG